MTLDAHAAHFYPAMKRDADKAHAILHSQSCICGQSLELMAREVMEALETARAELVGGRTSERTPR